MVIIMHMYCSSEGRVLWAPCGGPELPSLESWRHLQPPPPSVWTLGKSKEGDECPSYVWTPMGSTGTLNSKLREHGDTLNNLFLETESCSVLSDSLQPHGLYSPWNSLGQNTGVGSLFLLQGIFPTQGSNPGLPHCRRILYQLSHKGSPRVLEWAA